MDIRIIRDEKEFYNLKGAWNDLLLISESRSVYLTWEWLFTWWKVYGSGRKLAIHCLFKDGILVAILPLVRRKIRGTAVFNTTVLEFLGTGEDEKDEVCSNLLEPIVHPDCDKDIYQQLLFFILKRKSQDWDMIIFRSVRLNSLFMEAINDICNYGKFWADIVNNKTNAVTYLMEGWEAFVSSLGRRTRKKLRQERKWLESREIFRYFFLEKEMEYDKMINAFIDLSLKRWNGKGACSSNKFVRFTKSVARDFFKQGRLRLSLMEVDGMIVAGNLDYCFKDTVYGYQTAYDPTFNPKIGVGMQGMLYSIEQFAREGFCRYDWYALKVDSYKNHFTSKYIETADVYIYQKTLKSLSLNISAKARRFIVNTTNAKRSDL